MYSFKWYCCVGLMIEWKLMISLTKSSTCHCGWSFCCNSHRSYSTVLQVLQYYSIYVLIIPADTSTLQCTRLYTLWMYSTCFVARPYHYISVALSIAVLLCSEVPHSYLYLLSQQHILTSSIHAWINALLAFCLALFFLLWRSIYHAVVNCCGGWSPAKFLLFRE